MNEPKADRYQRLTRRVRLVGLAAGVVLLAVLTFTPAARKVSDAGAAASAWLPSTPASWAATTFFLTAVVVLWEIVTFGLVASFGGRVERRFGKTDTSVSDLIGAHLRAGALTLALALGAAAIVALTVRFLGPLWWVGAGVASALAWIAALRLLPALLPGVAAARPVTRRSLLSGLREIARHSDVPVSEILEWRIEDGARATALVTGIGRTRRVLVASSLLRDWSDDEIAVVVAHELAHHVHGDLWRALALDAAVLSLAYWTSAKVLVMSAATLGLLGPTDPAALPLLALVAGAVWVAATPVRFALSRAQERRADRFALKLTREAGAFGVAVRRLSARHLAEERPSALTRWLFHRHPPVAERLAMAESFARREASAAIASPRP